MQKVKPGCTGMQKVPGLTEMHRDTKGLNGIYPFANHGEYYIIRAKRAFIYAPCRKFRPREKDMRLNIKRVNFQCGTRHFFFLLCFCYISRLSAEILDRRNRPKKISMHFLDDINVGYSTFFEGTRPRRSSHGMPPVQSTLNLPSGCHCCRVIQILNI